MEDILVVADIRDPVVSLQVLWTVTAAENPGLDSVQRQLVHPE